MKKRVFTQPLYYIMSFAIGLTLIGMIASTLYLQQNSSPVHAEHAGTHSFTLQLARPHYWMAGPATQVKGLSCQAQNAVNRCYTPQQIQKAYNIAPLLAARTTGLGHTIVIVDAFQIQPFAMTSRYLIQRLASKQPNSTLLHPMVSPYSTQMMRLR